MPTNCRLAELPARSIKSKSSARPLSAGAFHEAWPDALLLTFPKSRGSTERDYKWLGSHRYGIMHLGGQDAADLRQRCEAASALLGWTAPYADLQPAHQPHAIHPAAPAPKTRHTLIGNTP